MAATLPTTGPASAPEANRPQPVTVDLSASEGPVMRGTNGALYGLSDDGVPGDAVPEP